MLPISPPPNMFPKSAPQFTSAGSGRSPALLKLETPAAPTEANKLTPALKVLVFFCGFNNCNAPCLSTNSPPFVLLNKKLFILITSCDLLSKKVEPPPLSI